MKRSIEDTLSKSVRCAVAVFLSCTLPAGWCDEGADVRGPRYYRRVEAGKPTLIECDVAVYGGTPAGVTTAIQAARMGKKTVLLSFNRHVGGITSGGLTATDIGNRAAIGGLALEFYARIGRIRNFRPSEAESLFRKMLDEASVPVLLERCLQSVEIQDGRLVSATMETGETIKADMFVDTTYEGDLLAAANELGSDSPGCVAQEFFPGLPGAVGCSPDDEGVERDAERGVLDERRADRAGPDRDPAPVDSHRHRQKGLDRRLADVQQARRHDLDHDRGRHAQPVGQPEQQIAAEGELPAEVVEQVDGHVQGEGGSRIAGSPVERIVRRDRRVL